MEKRVGVRHGAPRHLLPVLDEDGGVRVFEDDIVLRVALPQLLGDLLVEVVVRVLGLPVSEWNPDVMQHRSVRIDDRLLTRRMTVFL
ncbi:MAG: hypothetical protein AB7S41_16155 [Parvibaculaceae bacterium]